MNYSINNYYYLLILEFLYLKTSFWISTKIMSKEIFWIPIPSHKIKFVWEEEMIPFSKYKKLS